MGKRLLAKTVNQAVFQNAKEDIRIAEAGIRTRSRFGDVGRSNAFAYKHAKSAAALGEAQRIPCPIGARLLAEKMLAEIVLLCKLLRHHTSAKNKCIVWSSCCG